MTWDELFERFTASGRLAQNTILGYRKHLKAFLHFWSDHSLAGPADVEPRHLQGFYLHQKRQTGDNWAARQLRTVLTLLRWAVKHGFLLVDPGQEIQLSKPPQPIMRILTQEEVALLLDAPNQARPQIRLRDRALLELLYGTGLRGCEVVALNFADLNLAEQTVAILGGKGRPRLVPFGSRVAWALKDYLERIEPERAACGEEALFLTMSGERMTPKTLGLQLKRYGEALGIPEVGCHTLRRACATHLLENGANIAEIKTLLGHADINSTLIYAQVMPHELLRSYKTHHPRATR